MEMERARRFIGRESSGQAADAKRFVAEAFFGKRRDAEAQRSTVRAESDGATAPHFLVQCNFEFGHGHRTKGTRYCIFNV